jgi:mono/diheme cytochrome c family protein
MPPLGPTVLGDGELPRIDDHLAALCDQVGRPGPDLWTGNCGTCHGDDARGGHNALGVVGSAVRCHRAITEAVTIGLDPDMPSFPRLSAPDVTTLQDHLLSLCPPGRASGTELVDANCARCHGATLGGTATAPSVRCATRVTAVLAAGRGTRMPAYPVLAASDGPAVVTRMQQLCSEAGRSAADLYAGNCASCHGATARGSRNGLGQRGPNIACTELGDYMEKVQRGDDDMPAFPALSRADITALYGWVHASFCADD